MPLHHALAAHAAAQPERIALGLGAAASNYGALWRGIGARYAALCALPRQPRTIAPHQPLVALCLGNHEQTPGWLALGLTAPVTLALIDPGWPADLRADMIARLAPDLVITPENARFGLEGAGAPPPRAADDAPFFIGFTSGTTARPKAFLRNRTSWRLSLEAGRGLFGLDETSHTLAPGPLHHGLTFYALAETLHAGARFTGMTRFAAPTAYDLLATGEIARLVAVPTMIEGLAREAEHRARPLPTRQITTAGAALPPALARKLPRAFPAAALTQYYGASELGFVSVARHAPGAPDPAAGVGTPFPGVEIEIRKGGQPLPAGEAGRVYVRGPHAIDAYLWAEGEQALRREGDWASVGDRGRLDATGRLTLLGRADGMVITGGYNVYPEEVAAVLATAPGVAEAEVLGVPDAYLGQKLVAVLRAEEAVPDLAAFCAARLPRYKVPRAFYRVTAWPLTASGKIARATLRRWIEDQDARLVPLA